MDKGGKPTPKKPYEPPALTIYGTVRDLTESQGTHLQDNPSNRFSRTAKA